MYPLLDHDDFQKSRKALMATSAFMLIVHELNILGSEFSVSGIKFELKKEVIVGFATAFLVYFFYVFILRSLETSFTTRLERLKDDIASVKAQTAERLNDFKSLSTMRIKMDDGVLSPPRRLKTPDDGESARVSEMLEDYARVHELRTDAVTKAIYFLKLITFSTVDMMVPVLFAGIAFFKAGSIASAARFLF